MANPDIAAQLKAAQVAGALLADKLENLTDPTQGQKLSAQAGQLLDQINRLQGMQMAACTADIAAQTSGARFRLPTESLEILMNRLIGSPIF